MLDIFTSNGEKLDPNTQYIVIPEEEYRNLMAGYLGYQALESAGVDNWTYYSDAFYDFKLSYANWYGDKFIDWIKARKDPDTTVDEYLKYNLTFEDLADFEMKESFNH